MGNPRANEQELHRRPPRRDELAPHSEITWFAKGGKCSSCEGEHRVLSRPVYALRATPWSLRRLASISRLSAVALAKEGPVWPVMWAYYYPQIDCDFHC